MKQLIRSFLVKILAQPVFYPLNIRLYLLALNGLGILNYQTSEMSGEYSFLSKVAQRFKDNLVVIDVGANVGDYSNLIKQFNSKAEIYAFEPHPKTFKILQASATKNGYIALNLGCGKESGELELYDYENQDGSSHASLYQESITEMAQSQAISHTVKIIDLDSFLVQKNISRVNLLKIDVEGHEYSVLEGLKNTLQEGKIDIIQFEFNSMNIISRTFIRDFANLLTDYHFFRLLPNHLLPIDPQQVFLCEIFVYQNIVAIHNSIRL